MLVAVFEIAAAASLQFVLRSNAEVLLWTLDLQRVRVGWAQAAGKWDDELGWPPPAEAVALPRDPTGAKFNPDFPDSAQACASAYGDSFIWGEELPPPDGWIEQLSRKLGCRVSNYGVSGYGTDQALVRFRRMASDKAPTVMLGIYPENVLRNVNQYRGFMGYPPHPGWLKGRFVLDRAGTLNWIERPRLDLETFIQLHRDPAAIVPHEYFLPDGPDGPVTVGFPYALAAVRFALTPRLLSRLTLRPSWGGFFDDHHPSGALPLTVAIAEAFARLAEHRGKKALVVIVPGPGSFRTRATYGTFEYAPLIAALTERQIDVLDVGAALIVHGMGNYCELYARYPGECGGHFGIAGGKIVAEVVAAELRRRGGF
jgi:hypothetical protein